SSGLIALAAIYYPSSVRSTGVGWATAIGRFGSLLRTAGRRHPARLPLARADHLLPPSPHRS
ncbi:MAG TPA: hypothetical protein VE224_14120, partial [Pseudolabrys sp.]|nr:hypothetical protein [Pseudolabrys sp.]